MDPRKKLLMRTGRVIAITYLLFVFILGNILALPVFSSEKGFDTPIFGPSSGNLEHEEDDYIEIYSAKVGIQDFFAEATFYNPYSTVKGTWDYGFLFRKPESNTLHAIRVTSDGKWDHSADIEKKWSIGEEGKVSNLRTGANQSNHLRIIILGDGGAFYVNGQFISSLDTSGIPLKGDVCVATGIYNDNEINGEVTRFKDFTVWSLDTPIFGPSKSGLRHKEDDFIKTFEAGVNVKNFIAEAKFYNPYSTTKGSWDYGFLCRHPQVNTHHAIWVHSDGSWYHSVVIDGKWNTAGEGKVNGLRTGASQYNHVRIIVLDDCGEFFVNGKFIASLDTSGLTSAGDVMAVTGVFSGDEINGEVTQVEGFAVWSLNIQSRFQREGSIYVTSNPSGAYCYLDGEYKGTTPLTITDVSQGTHTLELKRHNYYNWTDAVNVSAGEMSKINATLKIKIGYLSVYANVDKAQVYVDDIYRGRAPVNINDLPVGSHTVKISADKYYDYYETVIIEANKTKYVDAFLEEKPGSIYVESSPSGAQVYVDGSYQGDTPLEIPNVKRGTYTLILKHSGYYDKTEYVEVYPDEIASHLVNLQIVFWRTWYFAAGVLLFMAILLAAVYKYKGKKPTPQAPAPTKLKSAFESAAKIARAPFVPIEALINIILPEKENRCPICDTSLKKGKILECINCRDEGLTCRIHQECWERHKAQQKEDGQEKIRCYQYHDIYISEKQSIHIFKDVNN